MFTLMNAYVGFGSPPVFSLLYAFGTCLTGFQIHQLMYDLYYPRKRVLPKYFPLRRGYR